MMVWEAFWDYWVFLNTLSILLEFDWILFTRLLGTLPWKFPSFGSRWGTMRAEPGWFVLFWGAYHSIWGTYHGRICGKILTHRELRLPQVERYLGHVEDFVTQIEGLYFCSFWTIDPSKWGNLCSYWQNLHW